MIGEVLTAKDLQGYQNMNNANYAAQGFVAPTIYSLANQKDFFNYYKTLDDVLLKYKYLNSLPGGKDIKAMAYVSVSTQQPVTLGYNVDFFIYAPGVGLLTLPYVAVRQLLYGQTSKVFQVIVRFYTTKNAGPYYGILDKRFQAIAATDYGKIPENKRKALNDLHTELQRAKANYNAYSAFIDFWSKRKRTPVQDKYLKIVILQQRKYKEDLLKIKNIDIRFSDNPNSIGELGVIPLVVWLVAIVAAAVVTAYSIEKITAAVKDVALVNGQNDFQRSQEDYMLQVAQSVKAGSITPEQAQLLTQTAQQAIINSQNLQTEAVKDEPGVLQTASKTLLWGGAIFLAYQLIKN